jgi:hypothetical protein
VFRVAWFRVLVSDDQSRYLGFRVSWFRVQGVGCRVQGEGFGRTEQSPMECGSRF